MPTPVIRGVRDVGEEPLPDGPLVIHFTAAQWEKLSAPMTVSKRRIDADAKGLFVQPDPFGGFSGWFACAVGSSEGVACVPELVRVGGSITFGTGCSCLRGKDPVERPPAEQDTCALGFTTTGRLVCLGKCATTGAACRLVRTPRPNGMTFVSCACA